MLLTTGTRANGEPPETGPRRQWTVAALVQELRALHGRGVRITQRGLLAAGQAKVLGAIDRLVGSIGRARALAQVPDPVTVRPTSTQQWSSARVISAIRERHRQGLPLATSRIPSTLRDAAIAWCGSWRDAITRAGLEYAVVRIKPMFPSREEVRRELRTLANAQPRMSAGELRRHRIGRAALYRYESLERALRASRVVDWPQRHRRPSQRRGVQMRPAIERRTLSRISTEGALRRRVELGLPLTLDVLRREYPDLVNAIRRHFGTINRARMSVGLQPTQLRWTVARLTEALRRRHRQGKSLRSETLRRDEPALHRAAVRLMGSAGRAVAALVPRARVAPLRDRATLLRALRARKAAGLSLRKQDVPGRLRGAARRFGMSWQDALEAAGLSLEEILPVRAWTADQVSAALRVLAREQPDMSVTSLRRTRPGRAGLNRFGSVEEAARRAGIDGWPTRRHLPLPGRQDVVRVLRARTRSGEALTMAATRRHDPRLVKAALKHFGTWRAALATVTG